MTTHNSIFDTKEDYFAFRKAWAAAVNSSAEITPVDHVVYNLLRGFPHDRGFTPITNSNKLVNGMLINAKLYYACMVLQRYHRGESFPEYFTQLFGDTVSHDMLILLDIPNEKPIYPNYGDGHKIAKNIIDGTFKPTNFSQIYEALEAA